MGGYTAFTNIRKKNVRCGRHSGGVTVFVKSDLVSKGFVKRDFNDFDDCIILILKGSPFNLINDVVLCFPYISPEGSSIYNDKDDTNGVELFEDYLLKVILKYPDASHLIAGDFNARCGLLQDVLYDDNVDYIFEQDSVYETDDFQLTRNSKDLIQNAFGRSLIELCKSFSIHIVNGRVENDSAGEITCVANDGSSIVDYFIVSTGLFNNVSYFEVGDRSESVHFPLHCTLSFVDSGINSHSVGNDHRNIEEQHLSDETLNKYKWDENKKATFLADFRRTFTEIRSRLLVAIGQNIEDALDMIVGMYQKAAACMKVKGLGNKKKAHEPWWDIECQTVKKAKQKSLKIFRT